ncbi:MAG TPA: hypothetical protein VER78_08025 [Thermoanaerobaculia bacterium]|nr:hypothetical protein [Thermoanaerobaculia bacterium]
MRFRALLLTIAAPLMLSAVLVSADKPQSLVVWPGYILELPPDHCVETKYGPDFHNLYLRDRKSAQQEMLDANGARVWSAGEAKP